MDSKSLKNQEILTDEEVATLIQKGDAEKIAILIERYEQKLSNYGRKFLANKLNIEDEVQEVFIKVYQNINSFDISQKFSSWVYRIAHNTFINALKKQTNKPLIFLDIADLAFHPAIEESSISEQDRRDMRKIIDKGLDSLNSAYREVLVLYFLEDLSYKEIAEVLHIPISNVGVRLSRAKQALKKSLEKDKKYYE